MRRSAALLAALALLCAARTERVARADTGALRGTKPGDLMFPGFDDADNCTQCHGGGVKGDRSFLPSDTWAGTMMGNAARDPVFFAALTIANQDAPGVGTYCLRCHSPIGFVQGHATPPDGSAFDKTDLQGVGCDTCHRAIQSPAPDAPYILSDAQLVFVEDAAKHGPYEDTGSPAHDASVTDLGLADARFCGQCHQVTNPDVHLKDATGQDTGLEFPLDSTYAEWEASDFARAGNAAFQSCADCHMPRKEGQHPVTKLPGSPLRPDPRAHTFVGGNHWGIEAVMAKNPDRATKYQTSFALALQNTLDNLAKAVKVTLVSAPTSGSPGGSLTVTVRVENLTGHKFPTGYAESRRAWVGISLVDAGKHERALLGGYDAATGQIQATPATRIYRTQQGTWDGQKGQPEEHLALHDMVLEDTRIPPQGFIASKSTTPSGEIDFSDGKGGYKSFDEATFTLSLPDDAAGDLTLSARVYYQSMTRDYIEFLKAANTTDSRGEELEQIWTSTGEAPPLLIGAAEATLSFPPASGSSSSSGVGGANGANAGSATGAGGSNAPAGPGEKSGCGCRSAGARPTHAPLRMATGLLIAMIAAARRSRTPRRPPPGLTARGNPRPA